MPGISADVMLNFLQISGFPGAQFEVLKSKQPDKYSSFKLKVLVPRDSVGRAMTAGRLEHI